NIRKTSHRKSMRKSWPMHKRLTEQTSTEEARRRRLPGGGNRALTRGSKLINPGIQTRRSSVSAVKTPRIAASASTPDSRATKVAGAKKLEVLAKRIRVCVKCPLHQSRTVAVPGEGKGTAK